MSTSLTSSHINNLTETFKTIGPIFSASILTVVGLVNIVTGYKLIIEQSFTSHTHFVAVSDSGDVERTSQGGAKGCITACLPRWMFDRVTKPSQTYFIGFLFGLSFDTASTISLLVLGLATTDGGKGSVGWDTLILPVLFTAGMCLVDVADSILMCYVYGGGAQVGSGSINEEEEEENAGRRIFFNVYLTLLSGSIALIVAGIEFAGVIADKWDMTGGFWDKVKYVNDNFEIVGEVILGVFVSSLLVALVLWKVKEDKATRKRADMAKEQKIQKEYCERRVREMAMGVGLREIEI
jgi:high-affinity nickel-transport protein